MKKNKTLLAFLIILCLLSSYSTIALAESSPRFEMEAWQLNRLGLYTGISSTTFIPDLGAKLDRQLGIALLLNFFGKKNEVMALSQIEIDLVLAPYSDRSLISPWARAYMAYAVKTGMIKGVSPTALKPLLPLDGTSFATMILRQMEYPVEGESYLTSLDQLCSLSGLNEARRALFNKTQFLKDDAVGLVYAALSAPCKDGKVLLEKLIITGVVSLETAYSQKLVRYNNPNSIEVIGPSLSEQKLTAYDQAYYMILDALTQGTSSVRLTLTSYTDTAKEVFELIDKIVREHPEILYYTGCTYSSSGLLTLQYSHDTQTIKAHTAALMEKVDQICGKLIKAGMTDFEKELAIHDYLIENCRYDIEGYESTSLGAESYSAYGALCLGIAVCEGYAEAAMLLLTRSGVECRMITGTSRGEGHAWNLVKLEGAYYHLDVTWDDPVMADGSNAKTYHYFNLPDKEISLDHAWDKTAYPVCNKTDYHYYTYFNLIAQNQEDFIDQVASRVRDGQNRVTIKIANHKTVGFNIKTAVEVLCNKLYRQCRYSFNDKLGIADLSFND